MAAPQAEPVVSESTKRGSTLQSSTVRNAAFYLTMRDGIKIAVDAWLPKNHRVGDKIPALIHSARYWCDMEGGSVGRDLNGVASIFSESPDLDDKQVFNDSGYAMINVDARGGWRVFWQSRV